MYAVSGAVGLSVLLFVFAVPALVAWLMAINLFVQSARMKGYYKDGGSGILWFIGIFATPIVVGIYVASLPDKRLDAAIDPKKAVQDELPSI